MLKQTLILLLSAVSASADPLITQFKQPDSFPLSFRLSLPQHSTVISHVQTDTHDTITAKIDDDRGECMVVEAIDGAGKCIWSRDFGYDMSANPGGCSAALSFHPEVSALIVSYHGYKSNHAHSLLFLDKSKTEYKVREYASEAPDIIPFLKKQQGYEDDYKYWICPSRFSGNNVIFSCIPLERPESGFPHPLAQGLRWFDITASLSEDFKLTPISATISHQ
ncbi:hypothetical protein JIN85_20470 [Luteolibacter pohnpeiensis]|uniref:Secreted protein n=1 Tax=Luteolibacter pohnpeiensis TaxID=454153 RepID=A0A934VSY0_9BACT|nr:hypothetical protein [Luteolibacter pohnpeiensis]MBK1884796.1 hypothetical protein [Luteolibacter pohnpeiensis]